MVSIHKKKVQHSRPNVSNPPTLPPHLCAPLSPKHLHNAPQPKHPQVNNNHPCNKPKAYGPPISTEGLVASR